MLCRLSKKIHTHKILSVLVRWISSIKLWCRAERLFRRRSEPFHFFEFDFATHRRHANLLIQASTQFNKNRVIAWIFNFWNAAQSLTFPLFLMFIGVHWHFIANGTLICRKFVLKFNPLATVEKQRWLREVVHLDHRALVAQRYLISTLQAYFSDLKI